MISAELVTPDAKLQGETGDSSLGRAEGQTSENTSLQASIWAISFDKDTLGKMSIGKVNLDKYFEDDEAFKECELIKLSSMEILFENQVDIALGESMMDALSVLEVYLRAEIQTCQNGEILLNLEQSYSLVILEKRYIRDTWKPKAPEIPANLSPEQKAQLLPDYMYNLRDRICSSHVRVYFLLEFLQKSLFPKYLLPSEDDSPFSCSIDALKEEVCVGLPRTRKAIEVLKEIYIDLSKELDQACKMKSIRKTVAKTAMLLHSFFRLNYIYTFHEIHKAYDPENEEKMIKEMVSNQTLHKDQTILKTVSSNLSSIQNISNAFQAMFYKGKNSTMNSGGSTIKIQAGPTLAKGPTKKGDSRKQTQITGNSFISKREQTISNISTEVAKKKKEEEELMNFQRKEKDNISMENLNKSLLEKIVNSSHSVYKDVDYMRKAASDSDSEQDSQKLTRKLLGEDSPLKEKTVKVMYHNPELEVLKKIQSSRIKEMENEDYFEDLKAKIGDYMHREEALEAIRKKEEREKEEMEARKNDEEKKKEEKASAGNMFKKFSTTSSHKKTATMSPVTRKGMELKKTLSMMKSKLNESTDTKLKMKVNEKELVRISGDTKIDEPLIPVKMSEKPENNEILDEDIFDPETKEEEEEEKDEEMEQLGLDNKGRRNPNVINLFTFVGGIQDVLEREEASNNSDYFPKKTKNIDLKAFRAQKTEELAEVSEELDIYKIIEEADITEKKKTKEVDLWTKVREDFLYTAYSKDLKKLKQKVLDTGRRELIAGRKTSFKHRAQLIVSNCLGISDRKSMGNAFVESLQKY